MVICDRHFKIGEYVLGTKTVEVGGIEVYSLCESCHGELVAFFSNLKKPVIRRKKTIKKPQKRGVKKK